MSFCPDVNDKPTIYLKHSGGTRVGGNRKRLAGIFSFRLRRGSRFSPVRFLKKLGAKVARVLRCASSKRKSSRKVSSSSLARSRSYVDPMDSHRAEAIEDCIEFLNSSCSLPRSNSVSSNSC